MWNSVLISFAKVEGREWVIYGITHLAQFRWRQSGMQGCQHFLPSDLSGIHLQDWPRSRNSVRSWKKGGSCGIQSKEEKEITYGVIDIVSVLLSDLVIEFSKRISDKSSFRDGFLEIGDICGRWSCVSYSWGCIILSLSQ